MKLAPNVVQHFKDLPLPERIDRIGRMGFKAVDMFHVSDLDYDAIKAALDRHGMSVTMAIGSQLERGLNDPSLHDEIEVSCRQAAETCGKINGLNVVVLSGNTLPKVARSTQNKSIIDGLKRLAPIADEFGVTIILEMLNSRYDHPGYYLDDTELMTSIVRAVDHPRVKGLYDIYHAGIMRGNLVEDIRASIDAIGHFHIAGIPGRHEPKLGELNYPFICRQIDEMGYQGYIGLEYSPLKPSNESLMETKTWIENG